jgi:ATP-binding cassette subfamily B multidrug efflux pump
VSREAETARPIGRLAPTAASLARAQDPRTTARRLFGYFVAERRLLAVVFACVVTYSLLGLSGPYLIGRALDRYIVTRDLGGLAKIVLLMLAAYVSAQVLEACASWVMAGVAARALERLRAALFAHVQTLPMAFFEQKSAGELLSRLSNDMEAISQAVAQNVTALMASVLAMVGIVMAMLVLDFRLALCSLLVVPIMLGFTRFVAVFTRRGFRELQKNLGRLSSTMEEAISGQRVVLAFRHQAEVIDAFRADNAAVYQAGVYANTYALLLMPLTTVLGNLFVIVIAGAGGWLALEGLVSVGVIASFINYGQSFVGPLRQISNLYNTLAAALAGAERVFEVIDTPSEVDAPAAARELTRVRGAVRFEHVSFGYRPGLRVIDDMSLEAAPGQTIALVGPTGAGKTTIIQLLTRFYEIDAGVITIDGVDIRQLEKRKLRSQLGLVLQDTYLFGTTVLENIRYGRLDASDDEVMRAATLADADAFIRQLPHGYQTVLSERAGNLSQGQRQLLAIARTLLADPAILILDEATSSVDTRTEANIQRSLLQLRRGRTSFVIAHRLSTIRDADQVLVLDAGRIVERGTHRELLERRGFYHRLYISQWQGHAL